MADMTDTIFGRTQSTTGLGVPTQHELAATLKEQAAALHAFQNQNNATLAETVKKIEEINNLFSSLTESADAILTALSGAATSATTPATETGKAKVADDTPQSLIPALRVIADRLKRNADNLEARLSEINNALS